MVACILINLSIYLRMRKMFRRWKMIVRLTLVMCDAMVMFESKYAPRLRIVWDGLMREFPISTLLDRIAHVCITTAHARRSGRIAKLEINKPSTSKLVRSLDEKLTVCLSQILHSALIFAHTQFYLRGCLLSEWFQEGVFHSKEKQQQRIQFGLI